MDSADYDELDYCDMQKFAEWVVKLFYINNIKSVCENCGKNEAVICQHCYDVELNFRECY
ncbi:hypothetical protein LLG07_01185 [bacterium]|nr:hypothetical protein [bacterium]